MIIKSVLSIIHYPKYLKELNQTNRRYFLYHIFTWIGLFLLIVNLITLQNDWVSLILVTGLVFALMISELFIRGKTKQDVNLLKRRQAYPIRLQLLFFPIAILLILDGGHVLGESSYFELYVLFFAWWFNLLSVLILQNKKRRNPLILLIILYLISLGLNFLVTILSITL